MASFTLIVLVYANVFSGGNFSLVVPDFSTVEACEDAAHFLRKKLTADGKKPFAYCEKTRSAGE